MPEAFAVVGLVEELRSKEASEADCGDVDTPGGLRRCVIRRARSMVSRKRLNRGEDLRSGDDV